MRRPSVLLAAFASALAFGAAAKLPPLSDEAKAKAAEAAGKASWNDKVGAYQLCQAQDKVAASYRKTSAAAGKPASAPEPTPGCTDPGPYVPTTPEASKPLEAAGAHSPPGTATSPPSNKATSAEMTGQKK
jgi:hypothetical protein